MFHSFYNAHRKGESILNEIIPAEIRVRASDNVMWVVANNSTGPYSAWGSCIARPDGSLESLERGVPGIFYTAIFLTMKKPINSEAGYITIR